MHKIKGFTLIEMLISMAIFAVVAFLTMMVVTNALRYNAQQQATVAAQSKLRRVTEVIGQEVRSSVFGGVAHAPYNSNNTQLSIYLLDQGAGYTVVTEPIAHVDHAVMHLVARGGQRQWHRKEGQVR